MVKTILAFVTAKRKSFVIADAICSAVALVYFVQPGGAFIGPAFGIPGLIGALLISGAVLASIFVKSE
jgi:hypothetical protein